MIRSRALSTISVDGSLFSCRPSFPRAWNDYLDTLKSLFTSLASKNVSLLNKPCLPSQSQPRQPTQSKAFQHITDPTWTCREPSGDTSPKMMVWDKREGIWALKQQRKKRMGFQIWVEGLHFLSLSVWPCGIWTRDQIGTPRSGSLEP